MFYYNIPILNLPEKTHKSWVRMEDVFSSIFNKLSVFALKFTLTPSLLWKPTITLAWTIEEGRKKYRVSQKRWVLAALSSACEILILNFASWWSRRAAETWLPHQVSAALLLHELAKLRLKFSQAEDRAAKSYLFWDTLYFFLLSSIVQARVIVAFHKIDGVRVNKTRGKLCRSL